MNNDIQHYPEGKPSSNNNEQFAINIIEGKGNRWTVRVVAADNDSDCRFLDAIDLTSSRARASLIKKLAELNITIDRLDEKLTAAASEKPKGEANSDDELDPSSIVRPERIIMPGLSAVAVPIISESAHGVSGRWQLYVCTPSDRFSVPLTPKIDLNGSQYFVNPIPTEPTVNNVARWSKASRDEFLRGTASASPSEVFWRVYEAISKHVEFATDLQENYLTTLTLWIMLTYIYHAWDAIPYLLLRGPTGSGKSTLFRILEWLCFNAILTSNPTAAAIFRAVHFNGGTYLFDEAERLRDAKSPDMVEVNTMLLAGYKRGGVATRNEKFGDTWKPVPYSVYSPKAIGGINGVLAALQSRCIEVRTQKAGKDSPIPLRKMSETDWQSIRDLLYVCSLTHADKWLAAAGRVCTEVHGRDAELWGPLLAIASVVDADRPLSFLVDDVAEFAAKSVAESAELQTPEADQILLTALADALKNGIRIGGQIIYHPTPAELLAVCLEQSKATFDKWSSTGIATRLRGYGITARKSGGRREYRCTLAQVVEVAERYAIEF